MPSKVATCRGSRGSPVNATRAVICCTTRSRASNAGGTVGSQWASAAVSSRIPANAPLARSLKRSSSGHKRLVRGPRQKPRLCLPTSRARPGRTTIRPAGHQRTPRRNLPRRVPRLLPRHPSPQVLPDRARRAADHRTRERRRAHRLAHRAQRLACLTPTGRWAATSNTDDNRDDAT